MNKDLIHDAFQWWNLIRRISAELDTLGIIYSFDASTSLFVHGIEIDMDDLDIMIQWDYFNKSYEAFQKYEPTEIKVNNFVHYHFYIDGLKVHILGSEQINNLSRDPERVKIEREEFVVWSKSIFFYRKHLAENHPLIRKIDDFVRTNKEYIEGLYNNSTENLYVNQRGQ